MNRSIASGTTLQVLSSRLKGMSSVLGLSLGLLLVALPAEANWTVQGFTIKDITAAVDGRIVFQLNGDTNDFCNLGRSDLIGTYTIPGDGSNKPNSAAYALLLSAYLSGKAVGAQNIGQNPNCDNTSYRYHLPVPDEVWVMP